MSYLKALDTLLRALEEPRSCFVLGAGASAPLIPFGGQFVSEVRRRILQVGVFPASPMSRSTVSARILGPATSYYVGADGSPSIEEELVALHLSPAAVEAAAVAALRPERQLYAPSQYAVFSLARCGLTLINFNVDGLADQFCASQHSVINMHGTSLSAANRRELDWERQIDVLQEFPELHPFRIPGLLLPQKEPEQIALTSEYRAAQRALSLARRLVLIGYSFGEMDDRVAYEVVVGAIGRHRIETVVIKPDASELAIRISQGAKINCVSSLQAYWDSLSTAIMSAVVGRPLYKTCNHARLCARCTRYLYEGVMDRR